MASFMTIQNDTELDRIASNLQQNPWWHKHVGDIKMQVPFRAREEQWLKLHSILDHNRVDAVLVSRFLDQDLLASCYLLAPIRRFEEGKVDIKIALILPTTHPNLISNRLTELVSYVYVNVLNAQGCALLTNAVNMQPQNLNGPIIFVDDQPNAINCLSNYITPDRFSNRQLRFMGFDDAHRTLLGNELPSIIVIDLIEFLAGGLWGPFTGLSLYIMIQSNRRLVQNIRPVLFSAHIQGPPLKTFDEVFITGQNIESDLNNFLRNM